MPCYMLCQLLRKTTQRQVPHAWKQQPTLQDTSSGCCRSLRASLQETARVVMGV